MRPALQALRSEAGEEMVLQDNFFIEKILPGAILRTLSAEEMAEYRRPFAEPGEGRRPTLTWPREIPIEGEPADVNAIVAAYADWLATSDVPKLFVKAEPGALLAGGANSRLRPQVASADRGDGRGGPFRPGRFAGRDRAGHRRLDGDVGLTGAMQDRNVRSNRMATKDVSVVLAHGAWADGSSWARVITALKADGVKVSAAPLPLTSLADDVAALNRSLDRTEGPIVLAAHAYAGAVIALARPERVKALVYVTALAPDEGEKVADVFYRAEPHPQAPKLAPDGNGLIWLPDEAFASGVRAERIRGRSRRARGRAAADVVQLHHRPGGRPLWKDVPTWFLVAEQDHMIVPETQRFMAERMKAKIKAHAVDHTPSVTAPGVVVDIIRDAIGAVPATEAARGNALAYRT